MHIRNKDLHIYEEIKTVKKQILYFIERTCNQLQMYKILLTLCIPTCHSLKVRSVLSSFACDISASENCVIALSAIVLDTTNFLLQGTIEQS